MVLLIEPHMRLKATFVEFPIDGIRIVGGIQTQVLWIPDGWLWAIQTQGIKRGEKQFAIVAIRSFNGESQRKSTTITQQAPFGSLFAAIGGSGADGGMPRKGL